jgi:hypothetical protein
VCNNALSFVDVCTFESKGVRERRGTVSAGVERMAYQAPVFLDLSQIKCVEALGEPYFSTEDLGVA